MAWPVTARYRRAVTSSYQVAVEAEIQRAGVVAATGLRIVGGDISITRSADVRRTCTVTVVGVPRGLIPTSRQRTALDIYGNELIIRAGIRYPDGTTELIPQGVFPLTSSRLVDTADGVAVELTGEDRAGRIAAAKLLAPWATAAGTSLVDAITALAEDRMPGVTVINLTSTPHDLPATHLIEEQGDPWGDGIAVWASAAGAEVYFDRTGRLVIRDVPDPTSQPVDWEMFEGASSPITGLTREYSDSLGGANAVVVTGETTGGDDPVRAIAYDLDPASPTYYYGGYDSRPVWISSPLVTTEAQAQAMADARGRELFGATEQVTITAIPNHAIDEADLIHVRRERSGFDDVTVADSIRLPLGVDGDMTITGRIRRRVS